MTRSAAPQAGPTPRGSGRPPRVPADGHNGQVGERTAEGTGDRARPHWVVLLLPALCLVGFALTVLLDVRTPDTGLGVEFAPGDGWSYSLLGVLLSALAAVVLVREPLQGFGWALAGSGLFWVTDGLAQSYVRVGLSADDLWPGLSFAAWYLNRFTGYLTVPIAVMLLLFPTGRLLPGRWGTAGRVSIVAMVVAGLVIITAPSEGRVPGDLVLPASLDMDPTTVAFLPTWSVDAAVTAGVVSFLVPMASVVVRYRGSRGLERDRMRWLLWAVVTMLLALGLSGVVGGGRADDVLLFIVMALPACAMTVAIVAPMIVAIDDLLARTLVLGGLSLVLLVADLAAVAGLTVLLGDDLGRAELITVVLLVSVLLYGPVRSRLWAAVQRAMLGDRTNRYDVVAGLASTLEKADGGTEQLAVVADAVAAAFGVGYVRLEVDRAHGERVTATHGTAPAEVRTLPITYRDEEVGRVVLPVRGLRSRLSRRDEELLGDLVRQAATAVRTSQLADELQDNRERLVVAREEERRRIRRDLHDGLGPSLSGLVFQLESARLLVDRDPDAARRSIAATSGQLQEVVADVRRLVHDLRPPALDDLGLVGALRQHAERISGAGLDARVEAAADLGALSAAVEVAAFRIAGEALTNVTRHARASTVVVRLEVAGAELVLEVGDDGVGIPAEVEAGVGLVSLRERAAELGGRTEVSCPPGGGTVVRAWLPLGRADRPDRQDVHRNEQKDEG